MGQIKQVMQTNKDKYEFLNDLISEITNGGESHCAQKRLCDMLMSDTDGGKLYKYRSFKSGHLHDLLEEQTLFCSKPSAFNDPFDCKIGVDFHSLVEAKCGVEFDHVEKLLEKYLAFRHENAPHEHNSVAELTVFAQWSRSEKLNQLLDSG